MCGRYSLTKKEMRLVLKEVEEMILNLLSSARYNIAPTQMAPVIVQEGSRVSVRSMRWGLQPSWSKAPLINLQSETVAGKPAFTESLRQRRCLIPADGFYEWNGERQAMRFSLKDGAPFCFAGLWENSLDYQGKAFPCYTILTTAASPAVAAVHPRMPLLVKPQYLQQWLDPKEENFLGTIRDPFTEWESYAVGPHVNQTRNEGPQCLEPAPQLSLF